jgi:photosystem II stability/assembly factor-like uncharacterized protein
MNAALKLMLAAALASTCLMCSLSEPLSLESAGAGGDASSASAGGEGGEAPIDWAAQTSDTDQDLFSVHFVDATTGWAVGNAGTIIKTNDGGAKWTAQTSGTGEHLYSVDFIDDQVGWAVGNAGTILKTNDGGAKWTAQASGTVNQLHSVDFRADQVGWAVGNAGTILKTNDGGAEWAPEFSDTRNSLYSVVVSPKSVYDFGVLACAVGQNGFYLFNITGEAGWTRATENITIPHLQDVKMSLGKNGGAKVIAVGDGGTILQLNVLPEKQAAASGTDEGLRSVSLIGGQVGWAVGQSGTVLTTSDGGATWTAQTSGTLFSLNDVHFIDARTGWAVGANGTILKTVEGDGS